MGSRGRSEVDDWLGLATGREGWRGNLLCERRRRLCLSSASPCMGGKARLLRLRASRCPTTCRAGPVCPLALACMPWMASAEPIGPYNAPRDRTVGAHLPGASERGKELAFGNSPSLPPNTGGHVAGNLQEKGQACERFAFATDNCARRPWNRIQAACTRVRRPEKDRSFARDTPFGLGFELRGSNFELRSLTKAKLPEPSAVVLLLNYELHDTVMLLVFAQTAK